MVQFRVVKEAGRALPTVFPRPDKLPGGEHEGTRLRLAGLTGWTLVLETTLEVVLEDDVLTTFDVLVSFGGQEGLALVAAFLTGLGAGSLAVFSLISGGFWVLIVSHLALHCVGVH